MNILEIKKKKEKKTKKKKQNSRKSQRRNKNVGKVSLKAQEKDDQNINIKGQITKDKHFDQNSINMIIWYH